MFAENELSIKSYSKVLDRTGVFNGDITEREGRSGNSTSLVVERKYDCLRFRRINLDLPFVIIDLDPNT